MKLPPIRSWADVQYAIDRITKGIGPITPAMMGLDIRALGVLGTGVIFASLGLGAKDAGATVAHTAAGRYTVTWTRPFPNGNYVVVGAPFSGASAVDSWELLSTVAFTASQFGCGVWDNSAFTDLSWMAVAIGPAS